MLTLIAAWSIAAIANAAPPDGTASQYLRTRWDGEQGFPGGAVSAIAQTADGYLWIGTEKGLLRFDGVSFRLVAESIPGFPPISRVLGLVTDAAGDLWIRLQGPRLVHYHGGRFQEVLTTVVQSEAGFTAMTRGKTGDMLIAGLRSGLLRQKGQDFTPLANASDMPGSIVIAIAEAPGGTIWLGSRDAGLYSLNAGRVLAAETGAPDRKINCLLAIDDRNLWIGTDNGLARWDGAAIVRSGVPPLEGVQALAMMKDRESNIWIGTSRGLVRVTPDGSLTLDDRDPRSGQPITALFEDREGNLWVGDTRGVERFRGSAFRTYTLSDGLPSSNTGAIFVDGERRTWFAPADGGLYWVKGSRVEQVAAKALAGDVVYSIAERNGELWIGRQHGGLTSLRESTGTWIAKTYTHAQGLAQDSVYAIYPSRDGAIWAATLSGGVSRFKDGIFTTYTAADGLLSNTVSSLAEDAGGTMWFATPNGLSALQQGRWRSLSASDGLPSSEVTDLFVDSKGLIWIGTASGLALLENGQLSTRELRVARNEPIVGIAGDRGGAIWIASAGHVVRVERDPFVRGDVSERTVREFGMADGLRSVEAAKRQRSVVADAAGQIWLSTSRGLSVVDPARLTAISAPAIVHIEAVSADGSALDLDGRRLKVPAGLRRVTFGYTGLSLAVPERVRYRYRLDGFDRDWSEPVTSRQAVYTNLNHGDYYFRVMASNSEGLWNGKEAALGLAIDPVFWQTWWFQVAAIGTAALGILALYRIRVLQLHRQLSVRFEERLAERTRIAQELHDTLLQGFVSASMQLHVATDQLPSDSPARALLGRVNALMGQVIEEGRNAVRGLRSPTASPRDLAEAFSGIQHEMAPTTDTAYRVIIEGEPRPLNPMIRDEVYRIGREALVNAFRHSRAKSIELELEYAARHVRILVRDDGVGMEPDVVKSGTDGHWGLSGMRERADRIGARLKVFSRMSAGTEIELTIPSAIAFRASRPETDQREG